MIKYKEIKVNRKVLKMNVMNGFYGGKRVPDLETWETPEC
jgi:hypothetical protein